MERGTNPRPDNLRTPADGPREDTEDTAPTRRELLAEKLTNLRRYCAQLSDPAQHPPFAAAGGHQQDTCRQLLGELARLTPEHAIMYATERLLPVRRAGGDLAAYLDARLAAAGLEPALLGDAARARLTAYLELFADMAE